MGKLDNDNWARVVALLKSMPLMTAAERREQYISFAWGNLACSTNHQVERTLVEAEYDRLFDEEGNRRVP